MHHFNGLNIVSHPLAVSVRFESRVERHAIKKRRRNWRVVKHRIETPCAYQSGSTLYMHPSLVAELKRQTSGGSA